LRLLNVSLRQLRLEIINDDGHAREETGGDEHLLDDGLRHQKREHCIHDANEGSGCADFDVGQKPETRWVAQPSEDSVCDPICVGDDHRNKTEHEEEEEVKHRREGEIIQEVEERKGIPCN